MIEKGHKRKQDILRIERQEHYAINAINSVTEPIFESFRRSLAVFAPPPLYVGSHESNPDRDIDVSDSGGKKSIKGSMLMR